MARKIATLAIAIEAQTAELKQGFADTQKEIRGLGAGMTKAFTGAQIAASALLEVFESLKDAVASVWESFQGEAEVAEFARVMGVSREEMQATADAFRIMTGEMEAGREIVQEMQVKLGEAFSNPDSTPAAAIKAIGVNLEELQAMNPVQRLRALSDALEDLSPDQAILRSGEIFGAEFGEDRFAAILRFAETYEETATNIAENGLVPLDNVREVTEEWRKMVINVERLGQAIIADFLPPLNDALEITRELLADWKEIRALIRIGIALGPGTSVLRTGRNLRENAPTIFDEEAQMLLREQLKVQRSIDAKTKQDRYNKLFP